MLHIFPGMSSLGKCNKNHSLLTHAAMKKLISFILSGLIIFLFSCRKENNFTPPYKNFSEIQVSSEFNWSTGKTVEVTITGIPTEIPVNSTLTISLKDGSNLYQGFYDMSQSTIIKLGIPDSETEIRLKYGNVEHILPVTGNKVEFSFIPTVVD
jgi:NurA-like 5'-3' nuclease